MGATDLVGDHDLPTPGALTAPMPSADGALDGARGAMAKPCHVMPGASHGAAPVAPHCWPPPPLPAAPLKGVTVGATDQPSSHTVMGGAGLSVLLGFGAMAAGGGGGAERCSCGAPAARTAA